MIYRHEHRYRPTLVILLNMGPISTTGPMLTAEASYRLVAMCVPVSGRGRGWSCGLCLVM